MKDNICIPFGRFDIDMNVFIIYTNKEHNINSFYDWLKFISSTKGFIYKDWKENNTTISNKYIYVNCYDSKYSYTFNELIPLIINNHIVLNYKDKF